MKLWKVFFCFTFLSCVTASLAPARPLRVVTTIQDLADIAQFIGGTQVSTSSLIQGVQDPHFIEPRPSMVARVRRADLLIVVGMELDIWAFALVDAARNRRLTPGSPGYLNASARIRKLEVPEAGVRLDAGQGHVHPSGNPHYLLDPLNGIVVAETIAARLVELRPEQADYFNDNLERFRKKTTTLAEEITESLAAHSPLRILTYHKSWEYFAARFGIEIVGVLEPLPGISPTSRHLAQMVNLARERDVNLILQASFYDQRAANFVSRQTGMPVVVAPAYVGGVDAADDYFSMFRVIAQAITEALEEK